MDLKLNIDISQPIEVEASLYKPETKIDMQFVGQGGYAARVLTDTTNFDHKLSIADTDVQKALETIDEWSGYEPPLPATPENPEYKFLNGNRVFVTISVSGGLSTAPVYFTTLNSAVPGYKRLSYIKEFAETELSGTITNQELLLRTYLYDDPISTTVIDAGSWIANFRIKVSKAIGVTQIKFEPFLYHADTTETVLFSAYSDEINNLAYETIRQISNQIAFVCLPTDRFGVRIYAKTTSIAEITVYTIVGGDNASYFNIPISTRHNQLRAIQGGTVDEYYHLTSAEYAGTGTGVFARKVNPQFGGNTNYSTFDSDGTLSFVGIAGVVIPHLMQSDSTDQAIANINNVQVITFNTDVHHSGITRTSSSRFTIIKEGSYLITFSGIAVGSSGKVIAVWLRVNNNDVPNSNTIYQFKGTGTSAIVAVSFIEHFVAGDYFEFWTWGDDTNNKWQATPAGVTPVRPATPSIIMVCNYVGKD